MRSNADVEAWARTWEAVIQRVRAAPELVRQRIEAGKANAARATSALGADPDAAVVWSEFALVNAADAILLRDGFRVRGKEGAHQARFEYPRLPRIFLKSRALIDRARAERNLIAYEGGGRISKRDATGIVELAVRAVADVEAAT